MEIRIIQDEELANAAGLSRFVFDKCLRNRMEFVQTIPFIEDYVSEANLRQMRMEGRLILWGAYEKEQMIAVSALQTDGSITMLYVLPEYAQKGFGNRLLYTMRSYAQEVLGLEKVFVNATPAWTASYFGKQGFYYVEKNPNLRQPYVTLYALTQQSQFHKKEKVGVRTVAFAILGCIGIASILGALFMCHYLF